MRLWNQFEAQCGRQRAVSFNAMNVTRVLNYISEGTDYMAYLAVGSGSGTDGYLAAAAAEVVSSNLDFSEGEVYVRRRAVFTDELLAAGTLVGEMGFAPRPGSNAAVNAARLTGRYLRKEAGVDLVVEGTIFLKIAEGDFFLPPGANPLADLLLNGKCPVYQQAVLTLYDALPPEGAPAAYGKGRVRVGFMTDELASGRLGMRGKLAQEGDSYGGAMFSVNGVPALIERMEESGPPSVVTELALLPEYARLPDPAKHLVSLDPARVLAKEAGCLIAYVCSPGRIRTEPMPGMEDTDMRAAVLLGGEERRLYLGGEAGLAAYRQRDGVWRRLAVNNPGEASGILRLAASASGKTLLAVRRAEGSLRVTEYSVLEEQEALELWKGEDTAYARPVLSVDPLSGWRVVADQASGTARWMDGNGIGYRYAEGLKSILLSDKEYTADSERLYVLHPDFAVYDMRSGERLYGQAEEGIYRSVASADRTLAARMRQDGSFTVCRLPGGELVGEGRCAAKPVDAAFFGHNLVLFLEGGGRQAFAVYGPGRRTRAGWLRAILECEDV